MRLVWVVCLALLTAVSARAEEKSDKVVIFGRWANPEKCNQQISTKVELPELLGNPQLYRNTCVTTSGFKSGQALFVEKAAAKNRNGSNVEYADIRLGLYGSERTMITLEKTVDKARIQVTGMFWTCDDLSEKGTVMVMGYCHHTAGPIIGMAFFTTLKN